MFVEWVRRVFGSVRVFMSVGVMMIGLILVFLDAAGVLKPTMATYTFLGVLIGHMTVFVYSDGQRPSGK